MRTWKLLIRSIICVSLALPVNVTWGSPAAKAENPAPRRPAPEQVLNHYAKIPLDQVLGPVNQAPNDAQKLRLRRAFTQLALAYQSLQILPSAHAYVGWWVANTQKLLAERGKAGAGISVLNFFHQTTIYFMAVNLPGDSAQPFIYWNEKVVNTPAVMEKRDIAMLMVGVGVVTGIGVFVGRTLHGAIVAGPIASVVSAFLEPVIRPIRQRVALAGERRLGGGGEWAQRMLNKPRGADVITDADLEKSTTELKGARREVAEGKKYLQGLGYSVTAAEYRGYMERSIEHWTKANSAWLEGFPEALRNGRNLNIDSKTFRSQHFANAVNLNLQSAETFRQTAEGARRDMQTENPNAAKSIREIAQRIANLNGEIANAEIYNPEKASELLGQLEAENKKLVEKGATAEQIAELNRGYRFSARMQIAAAYNLASHIQHEIEYKEFNRALPQELLQRVGDFREGVGLNFFHREFRNQVVAHLEMMNFKVEAYEAGLDNLRRTRAQRIAGPQKGQGFDAAIAAQSGNPAEAAKAQKRSLWESIKAKARGR